MKLDGIDTYVTTPPTGIGGSHWVLVRVTTDDGITGVGECYGVPFAGDVVARMVEDTFDRYIAGEDPTTSRRCTAASTPPDPPSAPT